LLINYACILENSSKERERERRVGYMFKKKLKSKKKKEKKSEIVREASHCLHALF